MNVNKVFVGGRLTRDIELRNSQTGKPVAKFGMATNYKYKETETVCYVNLVAFGRQAEVLAQYLKKGDPLFVEGRLSFSSWEAQDGSKRSALEVVVEKFQFIGGKSRDEGSKTTHTTTEIPF